jgi:hypothetical protein
MGSLPSKNPGQNPLKKIFISFSIYIHLFRLLNKILI